VIAVFTYKEPLYKIYKVNTDQKVWIKKAIEGARKVGYSTALYTDSKSFAEGLDLDEIHFISDEYTLWDSFKIYVLDNRSGNDYFLCDNDCVFHKHIDFSDDVDLYFDGFEVDVWDSFYKPTLNLLETKGLYDYSFWSKDEVGVTNIGILKINNDVLKTRYTHYWKRSYHLVKEHKSEFNKIGLTATISQFLLTKIMTEMNSSYKFFTTEKHYSNWSESNKYYRHYRGYLKLKNQSVI